MKSFHGHAGLSFSGTASNSGQTVSLDRAATTLKVNLSDRAPSPLKRYVLFDGTVTGGNVAVDDTFNNGGSLGSETYTGPLAGGLPDGAAQLQIDTKKCLYTLYVFFNVQTTPSGFRPNDDRANGYAFTGDEHLHRHLTLIGSPDLPAYYDTCHVGTVGKGDPACSSFGGGWAQEFENTDTCFGSCGSHLEPAGHAEFGWVLAPRYKHHTH